MLTVTCFVMGLGFGLASSHSQHIHLDVPSFPRPLFFAPLSELFGRKPIYCVSIFLYSIFTLPSALAKNGATLIIGRMLAGLAASAPMCNVGGTIADVWSVEQRGAPMAIFSATILYVHHSLNVFRRLTHMAHTALVPALVLCWVVGSACVWVGDGSTGSSSSSLAFVLYSRSSCPKLSLRFFSTRKQRNYERTQATTSTVLSRNSRKSPSPSPSKLLWFVLWL